MKIGFASNDWAMKALDAEGRPTWGGSGWARCGLPAKYLAQNGHDVTVGTLIADGLRLGVAPWDGDKPVPRDGWVFDFDVLVLQRWMFGDIGDRIRSMRADGQVVLNDLDDWFWGLDPRNVAYAATDPRRNIFENRQHYKRVLAASSAITVSTPYLRTRVQEMFPSTPVHILENHVEVSAFTPRPIQATRKPVYGWVGAIPWRSGDIETLRGVLGPFLLETGTTFHHSGHYGGEDGPKFWEAAKLDSNWVTCSPMVPIDAYPSLFEAMEVGIVPLSDRPFNRAKSCIKGLEYAAAGVPFVAQALPEYRRLERNGIGRTARKPVDWLRHLRELREPEVRMADQARNLAAVKDFDIASGWTRWLDLYLAKAGG